MAADRPAAGTPDPLPIETPPGDPAADHAFLRACVGSWLTLCVLTAAAVLLLDPLGTLGTGLFPSVIWRDRDEKAAAYVRSDPKPAVVLVGSSHVMSLPPGCASELLGARAFN